jgi:hypothetical protein
VVTAHSESGHASIRNALLYADCVNWFQVDAAVAAMRDLADFLTDRSNSTPLRTRNLDNVDFIAEVRQSGAGEFIVQCVNPQSILQRFPAEFSGDQVSQVLEMMAGGLLDGVRAIDNCSVLVSHVGRLQENGFWNVNSAVAELQGAISRLYLPDVAGLPLEMIMDMRDRLASSLDPMRAEMLRLTEELRKCVAGTKEPSTRSVQAEAANLIRTRVEPVIREVDQRVRDLAQSRLRTFLVGLPKALGFFGAGFVGSFWAELGLGWESGPIPWRNGLWCPAREEQSRFGRRFRHGYVRTRRKIVPQ